MGSRRRGGTEPESAGVRFGRSDNRQPHFTTAMLIRAASGATIWGLSLGCRGVPKEGSLVGTIPFRQLLPVVLTPTSAVFGGIGLLQRSAILSKPVWGGTLWHTTARFHIWPWPYKFAAMLNLPAFLAGLL